MAIVDSLLFFEPLAGTAVTSTAVSTNVLDFGVVAGTYNQGRDMGAFYSPGADLLVTCVTSFTSGSANTTLNVQVQGAPDNGSGAPGGYQTIFESGVMYLGQLVAGQKPIQTLMAAMSDPIIKPFTTTATCSSSSTTLTVASATGILYGQVVYMPGVVTPGTTVTGISGTTITISAATVAAASSATAVSFFATQPLPRYYRLNYVVANGPFTGGSLFAGIVVDSDRQPMYAPGFAFPSGT